MNRTLKALGLGLLAALAVSAFAVVGASADVTKHTGGHFTTFPTTAPTPIHIHGHGGPIPPNTHQLKWHMFGQIFECTEDYAATLNAHTVESITITAAYTACGNERVFHMNGCTTTLTIRDTSVSTLHNAIHIVCPVGKKAEMTASGCVITIGPQTITNAATYTTTTVGSPAVHAITAHITAKEIKYEKHGLCEFLSPFGTGPHGGANGCEVTGTMLLTAKDALGNPVGITATGTNGH